MSRSSHLQPPTSYIGQHGAEMDHIPCLLRLSVAGAGQFCSQFRLDIRRRDAARRLFPPSISSNVQGPENTAHAAIRTNHSHRRFTMSITAVHILRISYRSTSIRPSILRLYPDMHRPLPSHPSQNQAANLTGLPRVACSRVGKKKKFMHGGVLRTA